MDLQLQQIFEPVFIGIIVGTILLLAGIIVFGGSAPRYARLLKAFVYGNDLDSASGYDDEGPAREPTTLETTLATALIVAIAYSLGLFVDRVSDRVMDGPAQYVLLPGKTDRQIKLAQFRKLFEEEWPEYNPECRPYTDEEILQTYYTANNFLKRSDPRASELERLSRRIHFSESISIVLVHGSGLLLFVLLLIKGMGWYARRHPIKSSDSVRKKRFKLHAQTWRLLRAGRVLTLAGALLVLAQVAHTAWTFDEQKYDNLVFGYYAVELQNIVDAQGQLQRADVGIWVRLPDKGGLLRGTGSGLFEASGVAWLAGRTWEDPLLLVANDNSPHLTIHDLKGNLLQELRLPDDGTIQDLEEIAPAPDGSFYLLGSHSTRHQSEAVGRQRLVRIYLDVRPAAYGSKAGYAVRKPVEDIDIKGHLENTCIAPGKCLRRGWKDTDRSECCDVNIEAMAVSPDGRDIYLGFREPVICTDAGPVTPIYRLSLEGHRNDPNAPLEFMGGVPADLRRSGFPGPVRISGMAYDSSRKEYQIVASYEGGDDPDGRSAPAACNKWGTHPGASGPERGGVLWRWKGDHSAKPVLQSITFLHKPEGIAIHPQHGNVIVFDNDDDPDLAGARTPLAFFSRSGLPRKRCAPLIPIPESKANRQD